MTALSERKGQKGTWVCRSEGASRSLSADGDGDGDGGDGAGDGDGDGNGDGDGGDGAGGGRETREAISSGTLTAIPRKEPMKITARTAFHPSTAPITARSLPSPRPSPSRPVR